MQETQPLLGNNVYDRVTPKEPDAQTGFKDKRISEPTDFKLPQNPEGEPGNNPNTFKGVWDRLASQQKEPQTVLIKEDSIADYFGQFLVTGGTPDYHRNQAPLDATQLKGELVIKKESGLRAGDSLRVRCHGYANPFRIPVTVTRYYDVVSYDSHCVKGKLATETVVYGWES